LARALLQRPRILILDECTSALDSLTEQRLFDELDHHLRGITTIVISHRPYPITWADREVRVSKAWPA
jgi:ABC-type bacteriocin/lantibiotic exporter with double-glycine peptidase domain